MRHHQRRSPRRHGHDDTAEVVQRRPVALGHVLVARCTRSTRGLHRLGRLSVYTLVSYSTRTWPPRAGLGRPVRPVLRAAARAGCGLDRLPSRVLYRLGLPGTGYLRQFAAVDRGRGPADRGLLRIPDRGRPADRRRNQGDQADEPPRQPDLRDHLGQPEHLPAGARGRPLSVRRRQPSSRQRTSPGSRRPRRTEPDSPPDPGRLGRASPPSRPSPRRQANSGGSQRSGRCRRSGPGRDQRPDHPGRHRQRGEREPVALPDLGRASPPPGETAAALRASQAATRSAAATGRHRVRAGQPGRGRPPARPGSARRARRRGHRAGPTGPWPPSGPRGAARRSGRAAGRAAAGRRAAKYTAAVSSTPCPVVAALVTMSKAE